MGLIEPRNMNAKETGIKLSILFLFLFSFSLFVSTCLSARQCFTSPCYLGKGLAMVFAVHDGEGFQVIVAALFALFHSFLSYILLFKSPYSTMKYGMLIGVTMTLAFVMLKTAITFGVKSTTISNLESNLDGGYLYEHNADCQKYDRNNPQPSCNALGHSCKWVDLIGGVDSDGCYRQMQANNSSGIRFNAVAAFAVLLFLVHTGLTFMLFRWRGDFDSSVSSHPDLPRYEPKATSGRSKVAESTPTGYGAGGASYQDETAGDA
eukprot:c45341_g1_i1.p1 GENE.c45341_g1_i1~~c45341_g1_i1.p1  ORF type:complete len:264 (-),score=48.16 c45341_g1_i1:145-936(-)